MRWRENDGVGWLAAELSVAGREPDGCGGFRAEVAFSGRRGGVSEPPFDGLNLGFHTADEAAAVAANRARLCAALGLDPADVLWAHQVHGAVVEAHRERPVGRGFLRPLAPAGRPEADGQIALAAADGGLPRLAPLVLVADCLPVAIAGPGGVGMLHCGWRPMAAGIVAAGVAAVGAESAAIGPGIGPCCFEVGDEVRAAFAALGLGPGIERGRNLDLPEIAARLLARAGVSQIERADLCTRCEADRFFSHRRDGEAAGRQAGLVWVAEPYD